MRELALHVLDIVQNSVEAQASRVEIAVEEDVAAGFLKITIADDGRGMDEEMVRKVQDPFVTTRRTRRVGMGLPLLASAARQTGGTVTVESAPGRGTVVTATFGLHHLDRAPLGDMAATVAVILAGNPGLALRYRHRRGDSEFVFDTREIERQAGPVPWGDPQAAAWTRKTVAEALRALEPLGHGPGNAGPVKTGGGT